MRPNLLIFAAFLLLVTLFIFSCTNTTSAKVPDERDLRDYPVGKVDSVKDNPQGSDKID